MSLAWRRRAVSALVLATNASGCASKLDFDAVSRGGRFDGAVADAAQPPGPTDAGPARDDTQDAALDTPDAASSAPEVSFSCAALNPAPTFCNDFENSDPLSLFSDYGAYPASPASGAITVDGSDARAGKKSLLVTVFDGDVACDNCVAVVGGINLDDFSMHTVITVEFDMKVELIDPGVGRRVVAFQLEFGSDEQGYSQHTLALESQGDSITAGFVEFAAAGQGAHAMVSNTDQHEYPFAAGPALGQWAHVLYKLDTVFQDPSHDVATLSVDDHVLFSGAPYLQLIESLPRVELGIAWVDPAKFTAQDEGKSWQLRYDDVLVRVDTSAP